MARMYEKLGQYDEMSGRWLRPGRKPAALVFAREEIAEILAAISGETAMVRDHGRLSVHERRVEFNPNSEILTIHYPTGVVEYSLDRIAYLNLLSQWGIAIIWDS